MTTWEEKGSRVSVQHGPPREEGDYRDEEKWGEMYGETKEEPVGSFLFKNVFIKSHCI